MTASWKRSVSIALLGACLGGFFGTNASAATDWAMCLEQLASTEAATQLAGLEQVVEAGPLAAELVPDLKPLLLSEDVGVRLEALMAVAAIGPAAEALLPEVRASVKHDAVVIRYAAVTALRGLVGTGKTTTEDFLPLIKDGDMLVQVAAAHGMLDHDALVRPDFPGSALNALTEGLNADSEAIRREAAAALIAHPKFGVKILERGLRESDATKLAALHALAELGTNAQAARAEIEPLVSSDNPEIVAAAVTTLGAILAPNDKVPACLLTAAGRHEPAICVAAATALRSFPGSADELLPAVTKLLASDDVAVRLAAIDTLATLGPAADPAIPALNAAIEDPRGAVAIHAVEALGQIGTAAVPTLAARLRDPKYAPLMVTTLGEMGPAAKAAQEPLIELLQQPDVVPPREVILTLAFLGADSPKLTPALTKIIADANHPARPAAVFALGKLGMKDSIKTITNLVEDEDPLVRLASAWALLQLDPSNPDYIALAVPRLRQALERPDPRVRRQALETLRQLGPAGSAAADSVAQRMTQDDVPALRGLAAAVLVDQQALRASHIPGCVALLEADEPAVRRAGLYALGMMGPAAAEVLPVVRKAALQGPSAEQGLAAWAALHIDGSAERQAELVPLLIARGQTEPPAVVVKVIEFLAELAPQREDVRAFLQSESKNADPAIRAAAAAALN